MPKNNVPFKQAIAEAGESYWRRQGALLYEAYRKLGLAPKALPREDNDVLLLTNFADTPGQNYDVPFLDRSRELIREMLFSMAVECWLKGAILLAVTLGDEDPKLAKAKENWRKTQKELNEFYESVYSPQAFVEKSVPETDDTEIGLEKVKKAAKSLEDQRLEEKCSNEKNTYFQALGDCFQSRLDRYKSGHDIARLVKVLMDSLLPIRQKIAGPSEDKSKDKGYSGSEMPRSILSDFEQNLSQLGHLDSDYMNALTDANQLGRYHIITTSKPPNNAGQLDDKRLKILTKGDKKGLIVVIDKVYQLLKSIERGQEWATQNDSIAKREGSGESGEA